MTDRHAGYIVTLEKDIREDDAQNTLDALRQIKGVANVEPAVSSVEQHIAVARAAREIERQLWHAFNEIRRSLP